MSGPTADRAARLLVVEDNEDLAYGLRHNLELEGHRCEVAADGVSGLARARSGEFDLVILDLMLPGLNGFEVLERVRREDPSLPVLVLSARGEETDRVRGLRVGADDYVVKPFGLMELIARVEALLRRAGRPATGVRVERFGEVEVRPRERTVARSGEEVSLSPKEMDLLLALLARRGEVATREELLREVWGYSEGVVSRTLDTHVAELRRKLEEDAAAPRHLLTVRAVGYRLAR